MIGSYALLACLVVPVFPHFVSPNEFGRWILAAAIVEDRSLEVSKRRPLLGPMFEDLATLDGRTYSNKAPGGTLVGLPGYLAVRPVLGPPDEDNLRASLTAMRLLAASLPALLVAWLLVRALRAFGGDDARAPVAALTLLFGTPLFAYGMQLGAHALVAFALFGSFAALFGPEGESPRHELLGGALLGLAVLTEYPAAVPAGFLVLVAAWRRPSSRLLRILAGGAPFAAVFFAYNTICFGGPLEVSYAHEKLVSYRSDAQGVGMRLPSPWRALLLLLHPSKGLLVFSPIFVLCVPAFRRVFARLPRRAAVALVGVPAAILVTTAAYYGWHGGWTVGPRYLLGAAPFLVLALSFLDPGRLEAFLLGASVLAVTPTSLVFPFVPIDFPLPWATFAAPLLSRGLVAPNFFHLFSRPLAVAVPFLLVLGAIGWGLARRAPLALAGALMAAAAGVVAARVFPPSPQSRVELGYVAEVYFEQPGALLRSLPQGSAPGPPLLRREKTEGSLPPSRWPF